MEVQDFPSLPVFHKKMEELTLFRVNSFPFSRYVATKNLGHSWRIDLVFWYVHKKTVKK